MAGDTLYDLSSRPRVAIASALVAAAIGAAALHGFPAVPAQQPRIVYLEPVRHAPVQTVPVSAEARKPVVVPTESLALARRFDAEGYDWDAVLDGDSDVPMVTVKTFPKDLAHLQDVDLKKSLFFRALLPMALQVNAEIEADRERLLALKAKLDAGKTLGHGETTWLAGLARRYGTTPDDVATLLLRVDGVPPSLMLAQAAEESGWGTSRFAREGNAVFGQWTWSDGHDGIVPAARGEGETHRIRAFPSVKAAIAAYVRNLNTHPAYERFRLQRAMGASGYALSATLDRYSERGEAYVDTLRSIMNANRLAALDTAKLSDEYQVVSR